VFPEFPENKTKAGWPHPLPLLSLLCIAAGGKGGREVGRLHWGK